MKDLLRINMFPHICGRNEKFLFCLFFFVNNMLRGQTHSPHLHVGVPGIFSDLLRSVQMLRREWGGESNGKLPHLFIPGKTASLEDQPSTELLPRFLRLLWSTCPWAEHSDDDDYYLIINLNVLERLVILMAHGTCIWEVPGSILGVDQKAITGHEDPWRMWM